ncbi:glycosyltransferase family 2 protein [Marinobacter sp.]|uniref:glycosyltransferase family 2 protein n=1 Tax=Marinobacter sp. TaxID=50741 RepID=UPI002B2763E0|nr:glycosyltransferase [Marinobacter sp.]
MSIEHLKAGDLVPKPPEPRSEAEIMAGWKGEVDKPLVSVVCHTYNHEHFIRDALNGFLMQETDFPFEIILNDDASQDGTSKIVQEYRKRYPRLVQATIHEENQFSKGISPRNYSFPKVRGKYIALCEGDDYWISPKKIQEQVEGFGPDISIVFHDALTSSDEYLLDNGYYAKGVEPLNGYTPNQMARGCKIPTASALFISQPFQIDDHESVVNGDHLIWATLASFGSAKFLPKKYSVYRYHPGGIWSSRSVLDMVEPALRSKRVIFQCVDQKFKTSAMTGFCSTAIALAGRLVSERQHAQALLLIRRLYLEVLKMSPKLRIYNLNSLIDIALVLRQLGLRAPIVCIKAIGYGLFCGNPKKKKVM